MSLILSFVLSFVLAASVSVAAEKEPSLKKIAYLVSDLSIPFWQIMTQGIKTQSESLGYDAAIYSAQNSRKVELENLLLAIHQQVDGIILSPTSSSASVTLLKLAHKASIPVVLADIGTDSGEYVSYISSDNFTGAYELARILGKAMHDKGWQESRVGIIAIPQKRENGKLRTQGFIKGLQYVGVNKAELRQQVDFSYKETYNFSRTLINQNPDLRAIMLQGSNRYQAALDAINDEKKTGEILLVCFDAEPTFLNLIPQTILVGAAMQQPFLMGEKAVLDMNAYLHGLPVKKETQLPILAISKDNISDNLLVIKRNVLGLVQ